MKPASKIELSVEPPIPEPLLRASEEAGRRKDAALDRLMIKLDADGRSAGLAAIIDQDREYNGRGK